jgi:hypothetical protein
MPPELVLAASTACLVFGRAVQQLNVMHGHYYLAAVTPYAIALGEVANTLYVVHIGWPAVPWVGTGGTLGVVTAMYSHKRLRAWLGAKNNGG